MSDMNDNAQALLDEFEAGAEQERAAIVARLQRLRQTLAATGNGEAALMVALAMADIERGEIGGEP